MGYISSSHYLNRNIQKIFEDILDTHIEIDNPLTEAEPMEEASRSTSTSKVLRNKTKIQIQKQSHRNGHVGPGLTCSRMHY